MKHIKLMQKYLANLEVLNVKFHNIHWNVVGKQFVRVHTFTEEIYDKLFEDYDAVAELLKMKGVMPLSTLADYLANTTIKEIPAKDFNVVEALEITKNDMATMRAMATEIRNLADEEGDFEAVAMFEEYVGFFSKNIWFAEAMLK